MLVGLLKVWWRTCWGSSPLPPPPQAATSSARGEREDDMRLGRGSCSKFLSPAAPQGSASPLAAGWSLVLSSAQMEGRRACPSCAAENPERARFCMSCGAALAPSCPSCGAENPAGAKFCMECGTGSAPAALRPRRRAGRPAEAPPEERRQATVLFADLSGYTAAAERMDPEAVKALVDRSLRLPRRGDRALRRLHRQVHRRQRDGRLRRAGRPRGRPRAGGPRRPRHAGRDGGARIARAARRTGSASRCASGSTPAR